MVERNIAKNILRLAEQYPSVLVIGPRQSGKTTLCKALFPSKKYFSFESPTTLTQFKDDPEGFMLRIKDGAVLDEVQNVPEIFSYLQGLIDENRGVNGRFVLTGSNNFKIMSRVSQSLAGRIVVFTLLPLSLSEMPGDYRQNSVEQILCNGFYPQPVLQNMDIGIYYSNYIQTYIERDVRLLTNIKDYSAFVRFISLCAGRIGSILDIAGLSNDAGVSVKTVEGWLSILEVSFILFRLQPWSVNKSKRLIKKPKLYFYDTGIACYLLKIGGSDALLNDKMRGCLFENFIICENLKRIKNNLLNENLYFYRTSDGKEVDLVVESGRNLTISEIKSSFSFSKDFIKNIELFSTEYTDYNIKSQVIYAGSESFTFKGIDVANYNNILL